MSVRSAWGKLRIGGRAMFLAGMGLLGAGAGAGMNVALAQADQATPPAQAPVDAPPPPPQAVPQPSAAPAPPPLAAMPAPAPAPPPGQWTYTSQYGWVYMPYAQSYTYVPAAGDPLMYVYYPTFGWRWLAAPWVFGWGPRPYWGPYGYGRFAWYARPWFAPRVYYGGPRVYVAPRAYGHWHHRHW